MCPDWDYDPGNIISQEDKRILSVGCQVEEGVLPLVWPQRLRWKRENSVSFYREIVINNFLLENVTWNKFTDPLFNDIVTWTGELTQKPTQWRVSGEISVRSLCFSESLHSIILYLFTLTGADFFCHAHTAVTVVLFTPITFRWSTSIRAEKTHTHTVCPVWSLCGWRSC